MQWDDSEYAGFSSSKPWIMVNDNKDTINVKKALKDENSILNYYKKLIKTYKQYGDIVRDGLYKDLLPNHKQLLVVSNFSSKTINIMGLLRKFKDYRFNILLNNYKKFNNFELKPYQSILVSLEK